MAYETELKCVGTLTAQVDLSDWQFHVVKIGTTGTVDKSDAITDIPMGILQNKPKAGQSAEVGVFGVSKCVAGELLVIGEIVATKANGRVRTAATTQYPVGTVVEIAADAQIGSILVNPSNTVKA